MRGQSRLYANARLGPPIARLARGGVMQATRLVSHNVFGSHLLRQTQTIAAQGTAPVGGARPRYMAINRIPVEVLLILVS